MAACHAILGGVGVVVFRVQVSKKNVVVGMSITVSVITLTIYI